MSIELLNKPKSNTPLSLRFLMDCVKVQRERGAEYENKDQAERSFTKAATAFNAITGHNLKPCEVALMLQVLKDVRQWADMDRVHWDSLLDKVSYASLTSEQVVLDIHGPDAVYKIGGES